MTHPTRSQNIDSVSRDAAKPISSYTHRVLYTVSTSTLFRSDPPFLRLSNQFNMSDLPPSDHKKTDGKLVVKFLLRGICCRMDIKDFSPKQASLCEYTWEVVICIVITGEGRSDPDIQLETPN